MNFDEVPPSPPQPKLYIVRKEYSRWIRWSYQLLPSGSKGPALHNYSKPSAVPRTEERATGSAVPLLTLSGERGSSSWCYPRPQMSLERLWRDAGVLRTLRLCKMWTEKALTWLKAVFPLCCYQWGYGSLGTLPHAPVATQLQHLQLLRPRPGPAQSPAPPRPPRRGRARPPASRAPSGRACASPAACPAFPAARVAALRA